MSFRALKSTRDILQQLRTGPGATALPSNINKIALTFAIKGKNESASARHFLQENLPRMQYNNPHIEYEVNRVHDSSIKPTVTIHYSDGKSKTLDIARVQSSAICEQIMSS
ncbi:hypothetical protein BCV72DRAFT_247255 [Rhizopus microsporus var. microsporus]|uniref:Ribosomal protein/NADH dehydrogenase domain-containing protein n=2 Tax=Rhizopus microsporus TaxID=58291 RepID=A0A2G4T767_RHIZD|nr:uncharacterized protein RHIMIDRAFT_400 [Rhizopus microsporus ATCC 52813]ORE10930.1 hypothetical protein BCV72DRAFT_247255 [Rhizopus microsporus var. microsporus]PHZ16870.1 hypothetical protein RHIMIDRAFT_400 [Rhizopus microsporus ATCC 52813]